MLPRNVLLLVHREPEQFVCRSLNFPERTAGPTVLEALGRMLAHVQIHQEFDAIGRGFNEGWHRPGMEAVEFTTVLTHGTPVMLEFSERPGISVVLATGYLSSTAIILSAEPLTTIAPGPRSANAPVSYENPGGTKR